MGVRKKIARYLLTAPPLLLVVLQCSYAQTNIADLKKLIPPSPNASSLGKYVDWPVSLFTGVPSINIPLYELKGRTLIVPISLNYHASGIRVGEVASSVGLGWSLDAGGLITRSVRGVADENPDGGYFAFRQNYPDKGDLTDVTDPDTLAITSTLINHASQGAWDTQPDEFMFNAMGKSFRFFFNSNDSIVTQPYNNVKLTADFGNKTFTAILEDGTKLLFGGTDSCTEITSASISESISGADDFPSSWYLRKIISATGEVISFAYNKQTVIHNSNFTETDFVDQFAACHSACGTVPFKANQLKLEYQTVNGWSLASIESDLGKVFFNRDTVERFDTNGDTAITNMKVLSKLDSRYVTEFHFLYNYVTAASGYATASNPSTHSEEFSRLILNKIQEYFPGTSSEVNEWKFNYNSLALPSRASFAQDHWGYFNGQYNTTLLPTEIGFLLPDHPSGDRNPDSVSSQAQMLTTITYPTGGASKFAYEQNRYTTTEEVYKDTTLFLSYRLNPGFGDDTSTQKSVTFYMDTAENLTLNLSASYSSYFFSNHPSCGLPYANLYGPHGNLITSIQECLQTGSAAPQYFVLDQNGALDTGNYTLILNRDLLYPDTTDHNSFVNVSLQYQKSLGITTYDKLIGGLRIKSIVYSDSINPLNNIVRAFLYDNPYIIAPVDPVNDYVSSTQTELMAGDGGTSGGDPGCHYLTTCFQTTYSRSSVSKFTLGSIQGGIIGYGKVTTLFGLNGANGKTISNFSTTPDSLTYLTSRFPYPPAVTKDWARGLELAKYTYDNSNNLVSKETNSFSPVTKDILTTYKIAVNPVYGMSQSDDGTLWLGVVAQPYSVATGELFKVQSSQTTYSTDRVDSTTTTTNYFYDDAKNTQPIRTETLNSKGQLIKTITRTALEKSDINSATPLSTAASAAIDTMLNRNIVAVPIQQDKFNDTTLISRATTSFNVWSNTNVLPASVQIQKGRLPAEIRIQFYNYDSAGNVLEQSKSSDVHEVYIWGYHNQYPVAKIIGSNYDTAIQYVTQSIVQNPSSDYQLRTELNKLRQHLPDALISTYTYKPLIGVTTESDYNNRVTYYEYDSIGRLELIRDKDSNILKTFCYNYAGQQSACNGIAYYNDSTSQAFAKNNCGTDSTGDTVNYSVPAHTYTSFRSHADANQQAQNDIAANGQAYANIHSTCVFVCNSTDCNGVDKRCTGYGCETGVKVYTASVYLGDVDGEHEYRCTYHYEWSEGSPSEDYTETVIAHFPCFE